MLPKTYILTDRVNLTILDEQYQYMVTYSIFGEILKIECPFLKLPVNAQKLTKGKDTEKYCLLYTSPSPRDQRGSRMPSSA